MNWNCGNLLQFSFTMFFFFYSFLRICVNETGIVVSNQVLNSLLMLLPFCFSDLLREHGQRYGGLSPPKKGPPCWCHIYTNLSIFLPVLYGAEIGVI